MDKQFIIPIPEIPDLPNFICEFQVPPPDITIPPLVLSTPYLSDEDFIRFQEKSD